MTDAELLRRAAERAAQRPFYLASSLLAYARAERLDDDALAAQAGCDLASLPLLLLCRRPSGGGAVFRADVEAIAARFALDAVRLARLIRRADAVAGLRLPSPPLPDGDTRALALLQIRTRATLGLQGPSAALKLLTPFLKQSPRTRLEIGLAIVRAGLPDASDAQAWIERIAAESDPKSAPEQIEIARAVFRQPRMQLQRIGQGTGQKDFAWPNVARLWLGEPLESGGLVQIDTNIDDMNPELYGAVSQSLFGAGALDVWTTPIQMKKGWPGVLLSVLAPAACEVPLADILLRETTTLGVRVHAVSRHEAQRTFATVVTAYGSVQVKIKWVEGVPVGAKPEYDDCVRLAQTHKVPLRLVYDTAQAAAHRAVLGEGAAQ